MFASYDEAAQGIGIFLHLLFLFRVAWVHLFNS